MEKYIIAQDFNTKDWFVYDNETNRNICWCKTEKEAQTYVNNLKVVGGNVNEQF